MLVRHKVLNTSSAPQPRGKVCSEQPSPPRGFGGEIVCPRLNLASNPGRESKGAAADREGSPGIVRRRPRIILVGMTESATSAAASHRWFLPALLLLLALLVFAGAFALIRLQQTLVNPATAAPALADDDDAGADALGADRLEVSAAELAAQEREFAERLAKLRRETGGNVPASTVEERDRFAAARLELLRQIEEAKGDQERVAELLLQLEKRH